MEKQIILKRKGVKKMSKQKEYEYQADCLVKVFDDIISGEHFDDKVRRDSLKCAIQCLYELINSTSNKTLKRKLNVQKDYLQSCFTREADFFDERFFPYDNYSTELSKIERKKKG